MKEFFANQPCHLYVVEWWSREYHRMVIATDTPLSQSRLRSFKRENKSVQYAPKHATQTIDSVLKEIVDELKGAYG